MRNNTDKRLHIDIITAQPEDRFNVSISIVTRSQSLQQLDAATLAVNMTVIYTRKTHRMRHTHRAG